jgi:hypothetical protein
MAMRQKIFVLFVCNSLVLFVDSCHTPKNHFSVETISVDITSNDEMRLSDYFEDFRFVKLFTDEKTLIGEISKVQIHHQKIYVSDGSSMFIFSEKGELLSGFNHVGIGPGEYQGIADFYISGTDIVILNRSQQKLLRYDASGKCKNEFRLGYWAMKFSPAADSLLWIFCGYELGDKNSFRLHLTQNNQIIRQFLPVNPVQARYLHVSAPSNFFKYGEMLNFFEIFNDTVYSLRNEKIERRYCIDYQGHNIPSSFFERNYADIFQFFQAVHGSSYAYGIDRFAENDRIKIFGSFYQKTKKLTVADAHESATHTFTSIKDDIFFPSLMIPINEFNYFAEEYIIFPVDALTVMEWRAQHPPAKEYETLIDAMEEEDNPALLIFKLKE